MLGDITSHRQMIDCPLDRNVGVYVQIFEVILHPVFCNAYKTDRILSSRKQMTSPVVCNGVERGYGEGMGNLSVLLTMCFSRLLLTNEFLLHLEVLFSSFGWLHSNFLTFSSEGTYLVIAHPPSLFSVNPSFGSLLLQWNARHAMNKRRISGCTLSR